MTAVRVGILGTSRFARRAMLPAMAGVPDVEVVAIASRDRDRAAGAVGGSGVRAVHGYAELLDQDDVDAVYLPLPAALHAGWAEAALRAGKHVLAEKPVSTDAGRTRQLCALATESRLALVENVMFVHHRLHHEVRKLLAAGVIGDFRAMHAAFTIPRLPDDDIRYQPHLCGGALWDVGVYPIRAAMHYLGSGLTVAGAVGTADPRLGVDIAGAAVLTAPSGAVATVMFGMDHAYHSGIEVCGSTGRLVIDRPFTPPADHRPKITLFDGTGAREILLDPDDQARNTVEAFVRAVRSRTPPEPAIADQARLLAAVRARAGAAAEREASWRSSATGSWPRI
ncbi:gfo/Idh/MocA family oxidoreductase [Nocardia sp. SYP-A9097]|uniref:Gfo/Idh/MocA family protein n=1 Tax=Nocardia sp. SYP-A9097 TaxID=2663237 RepID=UPI0013224D66|nr:Gfo/Idh/MocA family oxidoreductase [Nocardia sp. SYP-A9097]MRH93594.1 gfo/Idh/MocA family oxidoreductase [Nocardia sp. SYP-A9097]